MQPYESLVSHGSGLWTRNGDWYGTSFRRRMTVMALTAGDLIIHNAFRLADSDLAELRALGNVVGIVVPNAFHGDEAGWLSEQFPQARVFAPQASRKKFKKIYRVDGSLELDWPQAWASEIACVAIDGMRILNEVVFLHRASRTLVLTDLVFNLRPQDFKNSIERTLMDWNRVGRGFGPSWLCDHLFTRDLAARGRSIDSFLKLDFDRIILNHGAIVETGGKEQLMKAFRRESNHK